MRVFFQLCATMRSAAKKAVESTTVFLRDTGHGLLEIGHNSLALVGLALVAGVVFANYRQELRQELETKTLSWLQSRHEARLDPDAMLWRDFAEPAAIVRATAADPRELNRQQAAVAQWLSRRYRVAPEPVSRLVQEAWHVGTRSGVDPTLILAIMAIESSFNPFAQSPVGAQGLMQVMTKIHDEKYEAFGGAHAAFDPVTNLRVGVQVLKECIARAGSIEAGLRYYVGAANLPDDGGYAAKVLSEQNNLRQVANGRLVQPTVLFTMPVRKPAPAATVVSEPDATVASPADDAPTAPAPAAPEQIALAS